MAATANERSTAAQIAALTRWGKTPDRHAATSAARQGLRARFEREADPTGTLPPEELERRVDALMKAHMLRMSLKAARCRRQAREARARARELERADELDALAGQAEADLRAAEL